MVRGFDKTESPWFLGLLNLKKLLDIYCIYMYIHIYIYVYIYIYTTCGILWIYRNIMKYHLS